MTPRKSPLDTRALAELARRHSKELEQITKQFAERQRGEGLAAFLDRYGRQIDVGSKVVTPRGETGRITRIDVNSSRALIELDDSGGKTRMLRTNRLELRRGRPRRDSFALRAC